MKVSSGWQQNFKKGFKARHAAGRRRIRFFHRSRLKVQQNPRDTFSNVCEYLHSLNCEPCFNGSARLSCTNSVRASQRHIYRNNIQDFNLPDRQCSSVQTTDLIWTTSGWIQELKLTTGAFRDCYVTTLTFRRLRT